MSGNRISKAAPVSKKSIARFAALAQNTDLVAHLQTPADESRLYDNSAPSTVARRARVRANYEKFCEVVFGESSVQAMYHVDTIIDHTCRFVEGWASMSVGILAAKIKIGTLYQQKEGLEWWIKELTPTFSTIAALWQSRVSRHIHLVAIQQELSTANRTKNNLGEAEIGLFFDRVMQEVSGVAVWKQHYLAWAIAFITGARPGSFTVTKGYERGAVIGGAASEAVQLPTRKESHTLRIKDLEFSRHKDGIACTVTFRYSKGHQDPYRVTYVHAERKMFFPPKKHRLHLDLSLLLFAEAYARGYFVDSLEDLLYGDNRYFKTVSEIGEQAVLVAADTEGRLIYTKDMGYSAINRKLQTMCLKVGLVSYNTIYAFRREAFRTTRVSHGTELAQELLSHMPQSRGCIINYDPIGLGGRDMTALRLGGPELSTEDISKYFTQASELWQASEGTKDSLEEELDALVMERLETNTEYEDLELELEAIYMEIHEALNVAEQTNHEYFYSVANTAKYRKFLTAEGTRDLDGMSTLLEKLDGHMAHRKTRRRDILKELRKEIREELAEAGKASLNADRVETAQYAKDDDYDDGAQREEARLARSDAEPEAWKGIAEDDIIIVQDEEEAAEEDENLPTETRETFLQRWLNKVDSDIATSGLYCMQCQTDPTMAQVDKSRLYTLWKLNAHLKGSIHTRKEMARRAFKIDLASRTQLDPKAKVPCPLCKAPYSNHTKFLRHMKNTHAGAMWIEEEEDSEDE
ncbi:hypothetical protein PTNB73_00426 [Pyrenophora teres f. teres]|nr:hypothetical protein HRS9139_01668 [Pyrenophora teres f. teres]KAE8851409.1 hypothetical protein HRS9122_01696 [Pyrenophora teres f. teres]KAE8873794.1 hypothetical protein PTNB73_00426 [Pyrenophora teres f. teres]